MTGGPYQLVLLDCDSTLSAIEGIDELARRAGRHQELAPLTRGAMEGRIPLDEVYAKRLDILRPDRAAVEWLGESYVRHAVAGAAETVRALKDAGRRVHVISGGIREAVLMLADVLEIDRGDVHAVSVFFDAAGRYRDFERGSPLTRPGGKAVVCRELLGDGERAVMVGDGATDLEVAELGQTVIGFGGVVSREAVRQAADYFVAGPSLADVVPLILGEG